MSAYAGSSKNLKDGWGGLQTGSSTHFSRMGNSEGAGNGSNVIPVQGAEGGAWDALREEKEGLSTSRWLQGAPMAPTSMVPTSLEGPAMSAEGAEQWFQRHPEAGSSWPSWPQASQEGLVGSSGQWLQRAPMAPTSTDPTSTAPTSMEGPASSSAFGRRGTSSVRDDCRKSPRRDDVGAIARPHRAPSMV